VRPTVRFALALVLSACATPTLPPTAALQPEPAPEEGPPPDPGPQPEVPEVLPEAVRDAPDDTARVIECMQFNHVGLITKLDRRDEPAVLQRLGELRTGRDLCVPLIEKYFPDFGPFLDLYKKEWDFYEAYFALTAEAFTVYDRRAFCTHFGRTAFKAAEAWRAARTYLSWLSSATAPGEVLTGPLALMLRQGTEKVSELGRAARILGTQHKKECGR
jgi:hypothetical protein